VDDDDDDGVEDEDEDNSSSTHDNSTVEQILPKKMHTRHRLDFSSARRYQEGK
jgi:hypothetical protein